MTNPIKVWEFDDAPPHLRDLSTNGGDEDWLVLIPAGRTRPHWTEVSPFVVCGVDEHHQPDGSLVLIAYHA